MSATERTPLLSDVFGPSSSVDDLPGKQTRLNLAAAYGALRAGKLPSQQQLNAAIDLALTSDILAQWPKTGLTQSKEAPLSKQGRTTLKDINDLLEAVKHWSATCNGEDQLQRLLYHLPKTSVQLQVNTAGAEVPLSGQEVVDDSTDVLKAIRAVFDLLWSTLVSEGTDIVADVVLLLRDLLADAVGGVKEVAAAVEDEIRPTAKQTDDEKRQAEERDGVLHAEIEHAQSVTETGQQNIAHVTSRVQKTFNEEAREEARDLAVQRFQGIVNRIHDNGTLQSSIKTFVKIVQKYADKTVEIPDRIEEAAKSTELDDKNDHIKSTLVALREALEGLAGGNFSLDKAQQALDAVITSIRNDDTLKKLLDDMNDFLIACVSDREFATSGKARRKTEMLYDQAQDALQKDPVWKEHAQELQYQSELLFKELKEEPTRAQMLRAARTVLKDVADSGKLSLQTFRGQTTGLYKDVLNLILPRLLSLLTQLPVPRTEYVSESVELVLDDLIIEGLSLLPDTLWIRNETYIQIDRRPRLKEFLTQASTATHVHLHGVQLTARNISFFVRRKNAWFFKTEQGLLEITLGKRGIGLDVEVDVPEEVVSNLGQPDALFEVKKVNVKLSSADIRLRRSRHRILAWLIRPFARFYLKRSLGSALQEQIKSALERLNHELAGVQAEANKRITGQGEGVFWAYMSALASSDPEAPQPPQQEAESPDPDDHSGWKATAKGAVKLDHEGEAVLAIGVDEQIVHGEQGALPSGQRIKEQVSEAVSEAGRKVRDTANEASDGVRTTQDGLASAREEADTAKQLVETTEKKELRRNGWRSSAFDI
ncbi:hypothetical protein E5Q_01852 [Mixia osmundae IAM 14324]|uniref:Uncharacterized protein n=1 Tax=Mixia osmundae (strain CBS 9802 / IAM 14324 / JCM 22182 / KY 12970) TaxID=764103 RepID=G7DX87_MIXOS|nr:hypothetical protein E5Q_01852 [Mixia osmundae IAM 14324]